MNPTHHDGHVNNGNNNNVVSGFPRSREQAADLGSKGVVPDLIIMLERPDELVKEFSLGRCTDPTTGVIYHPKVLSNDFAASEMLAAARLQSAVEQS